PICKSTFKGSRIFKYKGNIYF
ncbi:unnamed protein product, partial [Allacma fusca]